MAKIEVGMLVEIVDNETFILCDGKGFIGHVGKVLSACDVYPDSWDIEGAEFHANGLPISFSSNHLRPINGHEKDIQETRQANPISFGDVMREANREVMTK